MLEKIKETADFLKSRLNDPPTIGMITGTGLGALTERINADFRLPYEEIPNFPSSTVEGHKGMLAAGNIAGRSVIAMEGRFHLYEGYSPQEVTFPRKGNGRARGKVSFDVKRGWWSESSV